MKRLTVVASICLVACLAAPAASTALPVSRATAHTAIRAWWHSKRQPVVRWCAPKRYGTICAMYVGWLDKSGPFASDVHGHATYILWVSRDRLQRTVHVVNLGEYVTFTVG